MYTLNVAEIAPLCPPLPCVTTAKGCVCPPGYPGSLHGLGMTAVGSGALKLILVAAGAVAVATGVKKLRDRWR